MPLGQLAAGASLRVWLAICMPEAIARHEVRKDYRFISTSPPVIAINTHAIAARVID